MKTPTNPTTGLARRRPGRALALLAAGLLTLAAAGLVAAHDGGEGVIHSCVTRTGQLKIVGPNDSCPKNQTALDWNRQGPQGPPGPQGDPGEPATTLFATTVFNGLPLGNTLDQSRTTPGVELERVPNRPFGAFDVVFPRSLVGCAAVTSLRATGPGGAIEATVLDDPDDVVRVNTAFDSDRFDLPFTVAVFC